MIENELTSKYGECINGLDIYENKSSLRLTRIIVKDECRNEGVGSDIMSDLINYADKNKQIITLTPSSDFGGNKNRLIQFYKRFGFKHNKGVHKSYEYRDTMIRYPNLSSISEEVLGESYLDRFNLKKGLNALTQALKDETIKTSEAYKLITSGRELTPEEKKQVQKQLLSLLTKIGSTAIFLLPGGSIPILAYNIIKKKIKNKQPEEIMENKLVGGRADNSTIKDIAKKFRVSVDYLRKQLKKGMKIESEHTDDKEKQKEIAMDHIDEFANYYEELEGLEKKLKAEWKDKLKNEGIKPLIKQRLNESTNPIFKNLKNENKLTYPKIPTNKIFKNDYKSFGVNITDESKYKEETVNVSKIIPTQKNVTIDNLKKVINVTELPELFKDGNEYYVIDGHHRISMAILNGKDEITAKVYTKA